MYPPTLLRPKLCALWIAALSCTGLFAVFAEDALIEGGLSPDRRLEIRKVRLVGGSEKGAYALHLFNSGTGQGISELHKGGYFSYDSAVEGACSAYWHSSGRYVAVSNVERKDSSSLYLFAVEKDIAKKIPMPDYALLALGKIKEGKQGFYDGPQVRWPEWIDDQLRFRVFFRVPPAKRTQKQPPTEYSAFATVVPVYQNGEYSAELQKLSHPLRTEGPGE